MGMITEQFLKEFQDRVAARDCGQEMPSRAVMRSIAEALQAVLETHLKPADRDARHVHFHIPDGYQLNAVGDTVRIDPFFPPEDHGVGD